jgi:hypothetical protein
MAERDYVIDRIGGGYVVISATSEQEAKELFQIRYGYWPN